MIQSAQVPLSFPRLTSKKLNQRSLRPSPSPPPVSPASTINTLELIGCPISTKPRVQQQQPRTGGVDCLALSAKYENTGALTGWEEDPVSLCKGESGQTLPPTALPSQVIHSSQRDSLKTEVSLRNSLEIVGLKNKYIINNHKHTRLSHKEIKDKSAVKPRTRVKKKLAYPSPGLRGWEPLLSTAQLPPASSAWRRTSRPPVESESLSGIRAMDDSIHTLKAEMKKLMSVKHKNRTVTIVRYYQT